MTTISTTQHQHTPLWMALTAAAALVVGGAIGVAVEHANDQPDSPPPAQAQSQSTTPDSFGGATTSQEFSGSASGSTPAHGSPGGATTSQESTR